MSLSLNEAEELILKFVEKFRKEAHSNYKPSTRQTISMSSLLSTMYFKKGYLTREDIVRVAIVTTPPPYQEKALKIMSKIVFGTEKLETKPLLSIPKFLPLPIFPLSLLSIPLGLYNLFKPVSKWFKFHKNPQSLMKEKGRYHWSSQATSSLASRLFNKIKEKERLTKRIGLELSSIEKGQVKGVKPRKIRVSGKVTLRKHGVHLGSFLKRKAQNTKSVISLLTSKRRSKIKTIKSNYVKRDKISKVNSPSLEAGPGENLLREWYELRDMLPRKLRKEVKEEVKETLIEWINVYIKPLIGSSKLGVLPSHMVKPCSSYDLLEYVDLEETIESLLSKCKRLTEITYDDLMIRVPERGNNAVVLLLDASGSMGGGKLATMVFSTITLLNVFSKDEVALAIFESDVFRVKEIDGKVEMNEIIDTLLDLEPLGGTCVSRALLWAEEQFDKSLSDTYLLFLLSDLAFYDYREAEFILHRMINNNIRVFVLVPIFSYNIAMASSLEKLGINIIEMRNWKDILTLLLDSTLPM